MISSPALVTKTIAAGLRLASDLNPAGWQLRRWAALAAGEISFEDFYTLLKRDRHLSYLTVDTTGACDLKCPGACYYHPDIDIRKPQVAESALFRAVDEAARELRVDTLVLAGKEPFLNPKRLFALLRHVGAPEGRTYSSGIVTNGRHIERCWTDLRQAAGEGWLDFIDISIDSGIPAQHDAFRGLNGTFDLAFSAARRVAEELPAVRLCTTSLLRMDNAEGIFALIEKASSWISRFYVFPIQPPPFTGTAPLAPSAVVFFLRRLLARLSQMETDPPIEVTVALAGIYLDAVQAAGLIKWELLGEDDQGTCYVRVPAGPNEIVLTLAVLPEQACRLARITYDGAYLPQMHFLQTPDPARFASGYIQDESIVTLYERGIKTGSAFHEITISRALHDCRSQACWTNCFGGWSVAENAFLNGQSLVERPKLCVKTNPQLLCEVS